jgi:integrase
MTTIKTQRGRAALTERREPYFESLGRGRSLGYRAGPGTWIARASTPAGMRFHSLGSQPDYTTAKQAAEKWFATISSGADTRLTVNGAIDRYIATRTADCSPEAALKSGVHADIASVRKHAPERFLTRLVAELTTLELERWRDSLPVAPATRRRIWATLAAALNNLRRLGFDPRAWASVRPIKVPPAERSREFIPTTAQLRALLAAAEPDFRALLTAAALTGARYGELAALTVGQVDGSTLHLEKSKTGARSMRLSSEAAAFFAAQLVDKLPSAYVFAKSDGTQWKKSEQHRPMKRAVKKAKLPKVCVFYSMRHYCLSQQLAAGVPSSLVAKNSGTSEAMLKQHYHKLIADGPNVFDRLQVAL